MARKQQQGWVNVRPELGEDGRHHKPTVLIASDKSEIQVTFEATLTMGADTYEELAKGGFKGPWRLVKGDS